MNNPTCRRAIQNRMRNIKYNLIYLQENKIVNFLISLVCEKVSPKFCDNFIFKVVDGKRGAIIIACSQDFSVATMTTVSGRHPLSADIIDKSDGSSQSIIVVYGTQDDHDKITFLGTQRHQDRGSEQVVDYMRLQLKCQGR